MLLRPGSFMARASGVAFPSWVLAPGSDDASLDIDFIGNRAYVAGATVTPASILTCARASPATTYYEQADGTLTTFAANVLRIGNLGLLVEESRTNVVLHSRDLTNAAWVKLNCTAAKDQTGPDGTVNGASKLTATAGNATCLQSIVLASAARWQSCYIKRITGTGTIEMTMDAGMTWTAVTVTSSWDAVDIPTQTLANPTVGFRIVTSGDAVAIDFVQNENDNLQRSSPIPTTTASVTRSADDVQLTSQAWLNTGAMTIFTQGWSNVPNDTTQGALWQMDHTSGSSLAFARQGVSGMTHFGRNTAAATQWSATIDNASTGQPSTRRQKSVISLATNDVAMIGVVGTITTDTSAAIPTDFSRVSVGSQRTSGFWNGYIERFSTWASALSDTDISRLAAANCTFAVFVEGHSIPISPAVGTSFSGVLRTTLPIGYDTLVKATSGATMATLTSRASALDTHFGHYRTMNPSGKHLTIVMIGYNDFAVDADSTATFLSQLYAYTDARRAVGHRIVVVDPTPSTTAGFNTWRATVIADVAANVGVHLDYRINLSGTSIGADADASDVAKYSDGIHPTAATAIVIANAIRAQAIDVEAAL